MNRISAALEAERRLERAPPITLAFADGVLTIEGQVADVSDKTRALRSAAAFPEVRWVVDHLRVEPAVPMEDGEIRDHVGRAMIQDSAFNECRLVLSRGKEEQLLRDPPGARGAVRIRVGNGVVTLDGDVPSLVHRRLAGVLAWWVPGTRDVENQLGVMPPEADTDGEMADAVRVALEKEPFVDASQIEISAQGGKVTLRGAVSSEAQKEVAIHDAWYVLGVDDVIDELDIMH